MRRSFAVEGVVELGTNERSEAALKLPTSRKPVCAADHGVQSAAVASGFRRARGQARKPARPTTVCSQRPSRQGPGKVPAG